MSWALLGIRRDARSNPILITDEPLVLTQSDMDASSGDGTTGFSLYSSSNQLGRRPAGRGWGVPEPRFNTISCLIVSAQRPHVKMKEGFDGISENSVLLVCESWVRALARVGFRCRSSRTWFDNIFYM